MAYFAQHRIHSVGYGAVILRRRDGANWVRAADVDGHIGPAGDQVRRLIEAGDDLAGETGRAMLLDEPLVRSPRHHLEQVLRPRADGYNVEDAVLVLDEGLPFRVPADSFTMQLLGLIDGRRTVRQAIAEVLTAHHQNPDTHEFAVALRTVTHLVELGFLLRRYPTPTAQRPKVRPTVPPPSAARTVQPQADTDR
jgi:hypothetical protein